MTLTEPTTIISLFLTSISDYVLSDSAECVRHEKGTIDETNVDFSQDFNLPINYALNNINDTYLYHEKLAVFSEKTFGLNKLAMYYQPGDFIGWHTNSVNVGYNLILTYSESGESYFQTRTQTLNDPIGWSYKTNEFTGASDWHRAVALDNRITLSYLYDTQEDRDNAIEWLKNYK